MHRVFKTVNNLHMKYVKLNMQVVLSVKKNVMHQSGYVVTQTIIVTYIYIFNFSHLFISYLNKIHFVVQKRSTKSQSNILNLSFNERI